MKKVEKHKLILVSSQFSAKSDDAKSEDPLSFNDLDREWELVNTALAGLNDKYRENLDFLQKWR